MAEVAPYNADETRCLERLPFYVFFLVAGADGVIDEREFERFVKGLIDAGGDAGHAESGVDAEVLANSGRYFDSLHPEVKRAVADDGAEAALRGISAAVSLLDAKLDVAQAQSFKRRMLELGESVAAASGGILGIGSVSKVEKVALGQLAAALGSIG